MTTQLCEMGMVYGCCCGQDKNTEKLHKGYLRVKYDGEEYVTCEGCLAYFDYDAYREDTEITNIRTGKDVSVSVRAWDGKN